MDLIPRQFLLLAETIASGGGNHMLTASIDAAMIWRGVGRALIHGVKET